MDDLKIDIELLDRIESHLKKKGMNLSPEDLSMVVHLTRDKILYGYVNSIISQVEKILAIDPSLTEEEILQTLAKNIVEYFDAQIASIRIYNPEMEKIVSFGSYPFHSEVYEETIPLENTIAGEVIKTRQTYFVPNLLKDDKYRNKEKAEKLGVHSMIAIPILLPRFSIKEVDTEGVLQIYYKEADKAFTPVEVEIAELLSRRVSYVIAKKRIMSLQKFHFVKDMIVEHVFLKLAEGEGIKMKDMFESVIPELAEIMKIDRCSLFSVMGDRRNVVLEAGYPEGRHGIGQIRSINEPYIDVLLNQVGPFGEFENEKVYPSHILIHKPKESSLLPPDIKHFLEIQQIRSVLYIPLKVGENVKYFLVFDAQAHHQRFTDEEIEIFTFFGKELTKVLRLEKMEDVLHDFKNPAIAMAGFAKRIKKIVKDEHYPENEKLNQALDIILKECSRLQELAFTLHGEGKESIIDLTDVLRSRFLINQEAVRELGRENIQFVQRELTSPLWIQCFPLHIERVIDNLLLNASSAIPGEGGELSIQTYQKDLWAVAEITNTGQMTKEQKEAYLRGETKGRGLHIMTRLVKQMGGMMWIDSKEGRTTISIMLPAVRSD
jgi:signal transduction histidine kinase